MKIILGFGDGTTSVLFSIKQKKFFSYQQESEKLHEIYGGEQDYLSLTGFTGSGFVTPNPEQNDLLVFGCYRVDSSRNIQKREVVGETPTGNPIWGYAPIFKGGRIATKYPFVLTDGTNVAFVPIALVLYHLKNWGKFKSLEISYLEAPSGFEKTKVFGFKNELGFRGLSASRFLDLREERQAVCKLTACSELLQKMNIKKSAEEEKWFHISKDGLIDHAFETDPRQIVGEVCGWQGFGQTMFGRRIGPKWKIIGELEENYFFQREIALIEWFSLNEKTKKLFLEKLLAEVIAERKLYQGQVIADPDIISSTSLFSNQPVVDNPSPVDLLEEDSKG